MTPRKVLAVIALGLSTLLLLISKGLRTGSGDYFQEDEQQQTQSQENFQALEEWEEWKQDHRSIPWTALHFAAFYPWQFWLVTTVPGVLLVIWLWLKRRGHQAQSQEEEEPEGGEFDNKEAVAETLLERSHLAVENMTSRRWVVEDLVGSLLFAFRERFSKRFLAVPQKAIGVGSAFEGWSPDGQDAVYQLIVPMKAPRGFVFHVEAADAPANHRICMEVEHKCSRDQPWKPCLCRYRSLHGALGSKKAFSLCTDSYLDGQKTAQWLQCMVETAWEEAFMSSFYTMEMLPSSSSCRLKLTDGSRRSLFIELLFGVQRGDSDIFLISQATEANSTPNTTWVESCAVAERKFFSHVARQAPQDTFHLECLQLCASILEGTAISSYALKMVTMHLLNNMPLSLWSRRDFLMRVQDVISCLQDSLENKHLEHFFIGDKEMPGEIILPPDFRGREPHNLFQHLEQDPAAHTRALQEFQDLRERLTGMLLFGA